MTNFRAGHDMTDELPPRPLFGEEWLTAILLAVLMEHCTGHSPEKARQQSRGLDDLSMHDNRGGVPSIAQKAIDPCSVSGAGCSDR